jgi:hypothetical protein
LLLTKELLMLNSIRGFVCIKVKVLKLILNEQHIIINLLLIKSMLLLNTIMGIVCLKVKVLELILKEQHIIINLLLIKELLLLNTIMGIVCLKVKVLELILKEQHIISNLLLIKDLLMLNSLMDFVNGVSDVSFSNVYCDEKSREVYSSFERGYNSIRSLKKYRVRTRIVLALLKESEGQQGDNINLHNG